MEVAPVLMQTCFAILMFIGILASYLLPIGIIRKRNAGKNISGPSLALRGKYSAKALSYCNCFGAGIFIAICFLGLMPVVRQEFNELFVEIKYDVINYPIPEFTVLMGFFLVLFFEQFVMSCRSQSPPAPVLHLDESVNEQTHHLLIDEISHESAIDSSSSKTIAEKPKKMLKFELEKDSDSQCSDNLHSAHGHSHLSPTETLNASGFGFFVLVFATSIHSLFEGLALGLLRDVPKALHLFVGIILHEILVAFALGINSARVNISLSRNLKFAFVFSLTVPIGILIGLGLGYTPGLLGKVISAVFQGLAAGTFLNVAFLELIPSELSTSASQNVHKFLKIMLIFLGFLLMAVLSLLTSSHH